MWQLVASYIAIVCILEEGMCVCVQNWGSLFKLYRKMKLFYCLLDLIALKKSSLIFLLGTFWPIFFNSAVDLANIDADRTFHSTLYIPCERHYCYQAVTLSDSCSVTELCSTLCDPMNCSTSGFPVLHHLPELAQTHVHWVGDAIQPSRPLLSPSSPAFNLSLHQGLF